MGIRRERISIGLFKSFSAPARRQGYAPTGLAIGLSKTFSRFRLEAEIRRDEAGDRAFYGFLDHA